MIRTLHRRNTLQERKYLENGTVPELLTFPSCSTSNFYTWKVYQYAQKRSEPEGAENRVFSFFLSSNCNSMPHQHLELLLVSFGFVSRTDVQNTRCFRPPSRFLEFCYTLLYIYHTQRSKFMKSAWLCNLRTAASCTYVRVQNVLVCESKRSCLQKKSTQKQSAKIEEKVGMAIEKITKTGVVVMENYYKETSLHHIYKVKQWQHKWWRSIGCLLVIVFHQYYSCFGSFFYCHPYFFS